MTGNKHVVTLYMSGAERCFNVYDVLKFSKEVSYLFGIVYEEMSFSYMDEKKSIIKTLKYTDKNIQKLFAIEPQNITSIAFSRYKEAKHFADPRLRISLYISIHDIHTPAFPHHFKMIVDQPQIVDELPKDIIINVIHCVENLGFHIEYGAAFTIETRKEPNYFTLGGVTPHLTKEERGIARALAANIRQYQTKIWDIFLHNIIKKDLISETMLATIRNMLADENIVDLGDKFIISLPLSSQEYLNDRDKLDTFKEKLRQLFKDNDAIMYQG